LNVTLTDQDSHKFIQIINIKDLGTALLDFVFVHWFHGHPTSLKTSSLSITDILIMNILVLLVPFYAAIHMHINSERRDFE